MALKCLYREAMRLQSFPPMRTYGRDDLYPICTKLHFMEPACIVWLYYAYSYTVALSPGTIPSFAVLHTEKLAFQCATLLSWK